jgi:transcriptional regulator with XRE-family HTH domain
MALGANVKAFRERRGLLPSDIAERSGVALGTICNMEERDSDSSKFLVKIARALGVTAEELEDGRDPLDGGLAPGSSGQVDHYLSPTRVKTLPLMTMEAILSADRLPDLFVIEMQDNSMAPKAPKGCQATMQPGNRPEYGNAALVQTATGRLFFRECRMNADGSWTAHALNPAFPSLHSEEHGLQVLALCRNVAVPWSSAPLVSA